MANKIRCSQCHFARVDKKASDKNWMAYECSNPNSEYYKALLNVTPNGDKQYCITWNGCEAGRAKI